MQRGQRMRIIIEIGDGIENLDDGILDLPYECYVLRVIGRGIRFVPVGENSEFNSYTITFKNPVEVHKEILSRYRNNSNFIKLQGEKIL